MEYLNVINLSKRNVDIDTVFRISLLFEEDAFCHGSDSAFNFYKSAHAIGHIHIMHPADGNTEY